MRRQWMLLAVALAASLVFSGAWLLAGRDDRRTSYVITGASDTMQAQGAGFTLTSLRAHDFLVTGSGGTDDPVPGAVWVVARLNFEGTHADPDIICRANLAGPEGIEWYSAFHRPASETVLTACEPGVNGTLEFSFEVPRSQLETIRGVALMVYGSTSGEPTAQLLSGEVA